MDPMVITLARQAGQALVAAMASDAWLAVRDGLTRLYGRMGESRAAEVANALEDSRRTVLEGGSPPEVVATRWQGRFEAMLEVYPEQSEGLREVIVRATSEVDVDPGQQFRVGGAATVLGNSQIIAHNSGGGTIWP
ncbi:MULTISPECIES: hypothetical protein [Micromonospora]|uniref:Uncharacterized protein n=1 Tax=Micromonospora solifontis TaxID=2487138 RepID=A0ABX9WDB9_9ACTN|nr:MULTISPECIES: hypothetical protein [Micromonospora]NES12986.1 hypothetical protein [Micromonospora sp. PPF5-17B]NES38627.1 hypothetical protein [Micromonospora solifontis]NES54911.1 hypothetical protein [Micromonospora sp. PPF5-6]RNL94440.1 hypothetical protein EFE23_21130 [Micromonospora solifontis]